jgi:type IV secretion system protein VirB9
VKRLLAFALLVLPITANAEVRPVPGTGDPRIQTVLYDPNQVIQLQVAVGYQLTLEFGADERIETVAVGDSAAWQVTPSKRGDHLFIKAGQGGAATNMTVITDARSYSFVLNPAYGLAPDMAFTVRLRFQAPATAATVAADTAIGDGRYRLSGARALRPSAIDDDGVHTYIEWGSRQAMPAVFELDADDRETLVNGMMRDGTYVIDSVSNRLLFRLDARMAYATRRPKLPKH